MNLDADPQALEARLATLPVGHPDRPMVLIEFAWALRLTDVERAIELTEQTMREAEALEDRRALGWAWRTRAFFEFLSPELDKTLELTRKALSYFEEVDDELGKAVVWDQMATMHEVLGDYSQAMQYAIDAHEAYKRLDYERGIGWALSSIGGILAASGDLDGAQRHFEEGLEIFERLQYPLGAGRLSVRLGRLYLDRGQPETARNYFARHQGFSSLKRYPVFHSAALSNLGEVQEALGDLDRARELFEEALAITPELAKNSVALTTRLALGRVMFKQGEHEAALPMLDDVAQQAQQARVAPLESNTRMLLADIYEGLGEPERALRELRRHLELREQVLSAENRTKLKHLEIRQQIEASRKDAEIHRLRYVELKAAQERLVEAEKLAVLGKLAAGVAHETNSPLGVVRNNVVTMERAVERLAKLAGDDVQVKRIADAVAATSETTHQAIDRLGGISRSLRRFAHLDGAERQAVDVVEGIEGALTMLAQSGALSVEVVRELAVVPSVWGHPGQLNQVFLTLVGRALEVTSSGPVRIRTASENGDVLVHIVDGAALTSDEVNHLFEVRFGQKGDQVRFRVGMSAAASTVRNHGGDIRAMSSEEGTTVTVRLPARSG